jgi:hypothetical protein
VIDVEDLYDIDDGEAYGPWMGVHLAGHHEDDVAMALAWAAAIEQGEDVTFGRPRRTYLRKVPVSGGGWRASYSREGGRGTKAVTVVETSWGGLGHRCHRCPWDAVAGIPASRFSDTPAGADYVWYCRTHADEFQLRWRAALDEELKRRG